jgi:hypothetical protein
VIRSAFFAAVPSFSFKPLTKAQILVQTLYVSSGIRRRELIAFCYLVSFSLGLLNFNYFCGIVIDFNSSASEKLAKMPPQTRVQARKNYGPTRGPRPPTLYSTDLASKDHPIKMTKARQLQWLQRSQNWPDLPAIDWAFVKVLGYVQRPF